MSASAKLSSSGLSLRMKHRFMPCGVMGWLRKQETNMRQRSVDEGLLWVRLKSGTVSMGTRDSFT